MPSVFVVPIVYDHGRLGGELVMNGLWLGTCRIDCILVMTHVVDVDDLEGGLDAGCGFALVLPHIFVAQWKIILGRWCVGRSFFDLRRLHNLRCSLCREIACN